MVKNEFMPLIFGTGASSNKDYDGLYAVLNAAMACGIRCFDTAPSYKTEIALGKVLGNLSKEYGLKRSEYCIQTKIDPWQMQEGNIRRYVEEALAKLQVNYLDSLLVHWFEIDYIDDTWKEFQEIYREGLVRQIGVCNVRERHIKRMLQYEIPPQIVQIERNPLRVCEKEIDFCQMNGIEVQAYSSLCKMDPRIRNNKNIQKIADNHGKSVGQTVLRWHLDTGVIPIFTSKKIERIQEYTDLYGFVLSTDEIEIINEINENYKIYLESCVCPGF